MSSGRKYILLLLLTVHHLHVVGQDTAQQNDHLKGYIKALQTTSFVNNADSLLTSNLIHNRINFKWDFVKHLHTRIEMRNRIFYGEQVESIPAFGKLVSIDNGFVDLTWLWVDQRSLAVLSTLDRALVNYTSEKFSITAGRQRINWGITTIWNPNDLFNAYNFLDFDYEERPGVDGVRVQYFPNTASTLELAYKPSEEKNRSVAAALYKFNKWKYDFQFLSGVYYNDITIGTGWAGNIKEAGFKGEVSYFNNKKNWNQDNANFSAALMADYSFKKAWYVSSSVLYIDRPTPFLYGATVLFADNPSAKSLMPFKWSFLASASKAFTTLFTGNLSVIYSPTDNSTIFFPTLTYNVAENFDLDLTAQCFFSDRQGAYKTSGNSIFLRIRWSF